jgi:hypothetical protein
MMYSCKSSDVAKISDKEAIEVGAITIAVSVMISAQPELDLPSRSQNWSRRQGQVIISFVPAR